MVDVKKFMLRGHTFILKADRPIDPFSYFLWIETCRQELRLWEK